MNAAGIELLIISDPSNMNWLTGYDGWSFYTHQAVILAPEGEPVWWGRGMDAQGARLTVFMDHENVVGYPDHYVQTPDRHPMQKLAALIGERWPKVARCAVEMDNYYFSAAAWETLKKELPNLKFSDATGLVNWQRAIKSETEITYMRRAAKIVEAMHEMIVDTSLSPACQKMSWLPKSTEPPYAGQRGTGETILRLSRWHRPVWMRPHLISPGTTNP